MQIRFVFKSFNKQLQLQFFLELIHSPTASARHSSQINSQQKPNFSQGERSAQYQATINHKTSAKRSQLRKKFIYKLRPVFPELHQFRRTSRKKRGKNRVVEFHGKIEAAFPNCFHVRHSPWSLASSRRRTKQQLPRDDINTLERALCQFKVRRWRGEDAKREKNNEPNERGRESRRQSNRARKKREREKQRRKAVSLTTTPRAEPHRVRGRSEGLASSAHSGAPQRPPAE